MTRFAPAGVVPFLLGVLFVPCASQPTEAAASPATASPPGASAAPLELQPDPSYGLDGSTLVGFPSLFATALRMLPTGDGRQWVVGTVDDARKTLAIARLLPDGTLDQSFGVMG